jgi:hypothetical protein
MRGSGEKAMITTSTEELERPTEWLRAMVEGRRYRWLLEDAGSFAIAAYRLARARCRIQPVPNGIPTLTELCAAARVLSESSGETMPSVSLMLDACDRAGLLVIAPLRRRAA